MNTMVSFSQYYRVSFPSDRIALRVLRTECPEVFLSRDSVAEHAGVLPGLQMMAIEQMLADKAFARARGLPDPLPEVRRSDLIRDLCAYYSNYGLSAGEHATEVLVRDFESRVGQQAREIRL